MTKFIKVKTVHQSKLLYININNIIAFFEEEEGKKVVLEITEYDMPVVVDMPIDNFIDDLRKLINSTSTNISI